MVWTTRPRRAGGLPARGALVAPLAWGAEDAAAFAAAAGAAGLVLGSEVVYALQGEDRGGDSVFEHPRRHRRLLADDGCCLIAYCERRRGLLFNLLRYGLRLRSDNRPPSTAGGYDGKGNGIPLGVPIADLGLRPRLRLFAIERAPSPREGPAATDPPTPPPTPTPPRWRRSPFAALPPLELDDPSRMRAKVPAVEEGGRPGSAPARYA